MTDASPPPTAREIAAALDRRRLRRRLTLWVLALAAAVCAALYLRCGAGLGIGGGSAAGPSRASQPSQPSHSDAPRALAARPCALRLSAAGLTINGALGSRSDAVAACAPAAIADVLVTGDAREGDWKALEAELRAARIAVRLVENAGAAR